jgi:hypothetical protein
MISTTYINRYNDKFLLEEDEDGDIIMTMRKLLFFRYSWDTKSNLNAKKYVMIDPSGGPYLQQGSDMGYFYDVWKGKIIDYFHVINDQKILITFKNEYENI